LSLLPIPIPESIKEISCTAVAEQLIDHANERIEQFMLSDERVIENFVTCDFHLFDQALSWIRAEHHLIGNRCCELGSGFGVVAMLAAIQGLEAVGIEIESTLVDQSIALAEELHIGAEFYCGSFVPRDIPGLVDLASDMKHVETDEGDIFEEIGLGLDDFDLFFAFPWPGENDFFEAVFEAGAVDGALLLTYRGREGMHLLRKSSE
jgi:hypothetical protein